MRGSSLIAAGRLERVMHNKAEIATRLDTIASTRLFFWGVSPGSGGDRRDTPPSRRTFSADFRKTITEIDYHLRRREERHDLLDVPNMGLRQPRPARSPRSAGPRNEVEMSVTKRAPPR